MNKALLIVDVQNDFLPTGALPVPEGDAVIPVINRLQAVFDGLIVATQDWHPPSHRSFASSHPGRKPFEVIELEGLRQVLWPDHCVQHSPGAELAPGLDTARIQKLIRKGTDPAIDSYSAFHDNGHRKSTGLGDYLRAQGVGEVFIVGLAADVCVAYTAQDALREGFGTTVVRDATRGVNLQAGDTDFALAELARRGAQVVDSAELVRR